ETVSAIVAFAAEDRDLYWLDRGSIHDVTASIRHASARCFHELKTGDPVALGGQAVDFAHLGSGENFHGRLAGRLEHPAAADVDDLAGDILRFVGSEKGDGGGNIFHGGRAADGKTRVADAACFFTR